MQKHTFWQVLRCQHWYPFDIGVWNGQSRHAGLRSRCCDVSQLGIHSIGNGKGVVCLVYATRHIAACTHAPCSTTFSSAVRITTPRRWRGNDSEGRAVRVAVPTARHGMATARGVVCCNVCMAASLNAVVQSKDTTGFCWTWTLLLHRPLPVTPKSRSPRPQGCMIQQIILGTDVPTQ